MIFAGALATAGAFAISTGKGVLDGNYGFVNVDWVVPLFAFGPPLAALFFAFIVTRVIVRKMAIPK